MNKITRLTILSEKVITWVFAPCFIALFALFFMGLESLMPIALGGLAVGIVALFVLYIWRFVVS